MVKWTMSYSVIANDRSTEKNFSPRGACGRRECAVRLDPMLVGLCGRSGSGKGYVAERFAALGIPSIDTDAVYRSLTSASATLSPCMKELVDRFGESVAAEDNSLDRTVMRSLVFGGDRNALADLNRITHKHILARVEAMASEMHGDGHDIVLIDAPLLYESGFDKECARVVVVTAPEETVVRRIMRRDGIDADAARARLKTQIPADDLAARADFVIENAGDDCAMDKQIRACADALRAERELNDRKRKEI